MSLSEARNIIEDFKAVDFRNGRLVLIDQRELPGRLVYTEISSSEETADAIRDMIVRGAPAIGGAAGYGTYLAAVEAGSDKELFRRKCGHLIAARPTAVNLSWAVNRLKSLYEKGASSEELLAEADLIIREDEEMNRQMGAFGSTVIRDGATILTHCNAGALATCGWGTALGVIKSAYQEGKDIFVYADETRPRLQGARLTAWELMRAGIPSALIPDSAAATLIRDGKIDCIILGADRIAANGDVANKLGTFALSVVAKAYGVPFYSAAPTSTIDISTQTGKDIEIEERDPREVTEIEGVRIAPEGMKVYNPCFDVTPHQNITGIITEKGIIYPPFDVNIARIMTER